MSSISPKEFRKILIEDLLENIPSVFRDEASKYLIMFDGCRKLGLIDHYQFLALVDELTNQLNWFSHDVPEGKIRECCEETFADVTLRAHLDKKK